MLLSKFLGLTLTIGMSAAQSTTVSLFLPDTDPQSLVASVVGADATATTYLISCPPGTDASNCGYGGGATVIEGPSTLQMVLLSANVPLETIACNLAGTTQAVCTTSETLQGFSTSQIVTSTLGVADITFFPIGVTAGAEKLGPESTGVSTSATSSASTSTTGFVGSISVAVSSTSLSVATTSVTELVSSSSETSATTSVSSTEGTSSVGQTQAASSAATASSKSAASRVGQVELSLLGAIMSCLVGGLSVVALL